MKATDIFTDLEEFSRYADGLLADTTYKQLGPSMRAVTREICGLITTDGYIALCSCEDEDSEIHDGLELLKEAVATGTLYKYSIFASVKRNGSDASLYKYQYEEIKQHHLDAFWKAMDALLSWLDENASEVKWTDSEDAECSYAKSMQYQERQKLPIKNAGEFDYYYGIDNSSYFFTKIQFWIREIWNLKIKPIIRDSTNEQALDLAKRSLCYQVMARAVMQFDITELPRSTRYDFNHEYTKDSAVQDRATLYAQLMADVDSWTESIQNILATEEGTKTIQTNLNRPDNKHYTML